MNKEETFSNDKFFYTAKVENLAPGVYHVHYIKTDYDNKIVEHTCDFWSNYKDAEKWYKETVTYAKRMSLQCA